MARRRDRLAGKRPEPFGATKKRGKQFEVERKLRNRIFELEQEVAALQRREAAAHAARGEAERVARDARPTTPQLQALHAVASLPYLAAFRLGLSTLTLNELARWYTQLTEPVKQ